jgi:hypothetical protein
MVDEKPKTLYLLLPVTCANEFLDGRPNYAVIEVDRGLVDRVLAQLARVKRYKKEEDPHIYEFRSWDPSPIWFQIPTEKWSEDTHKDLLTGEEYGMVNFENSEPILLDAMPDFDVDNSDNRTQCETRIVTDSDVKWDAIPKHTSDYVDTAQVSLETWKAIRKLLKAKE